MDPAFEILFFSGSRSLLTLALVLEKKVILDIRKKTIAPNHEEQQQHMNAQVWHSNSFLQMFGRHRLSKSLAFCKFASVNFDPYKTTITLPPKYSWLYTFW